MRGLARAASREGLAQAWQMAREMNDAARPMGSQARSTSISGEGRAASGAALVLTAAALWSTGGVGIETAVAEPLVIAGLRSVFALVFMLVALVAATVARVWGRAARARCCEGRSCGAPPRATR